MPCFYPIIAYPSVRKNPDTGKRKLVFKPSAANPAFVDRPTMVPCGQCIGCRLERSRQWAIRCVHEAKLHDANSFITLTYAPAFLPSDGSLSVREFQLFMKRLRKNLSKQGIFVRHFACGEYGEKLGRPHYHACIFGYDFPDKVLYEVNHKGQKLYTSDTLDLAWGKGLATIGELTFESAAYVARYVTKKVTGEKSFEHYGTKVPEFTLHSKKPGIGQAFFFKFKSDIYPHDEVIVRGRQMRPPRYYDSQLEKDDPEEYRRLRQRRHKTPQQMLQGDGDPLRRRPRERVQLARFKRLERKIEDET